MCMRVGAHFCACDYDDDAAAANDDDGGADAGGGGGSGVVVGGGGEVCGIANDNDNDKFHRRVFDTFKLDRWLHVEYTFMYYVYA